MTDRYKNTSYIFLPFRLLKSEGTLDFVRSLEAYGWKMIRNDQHYLFKYITDRMLSDDDNMRQCFHLTMGEDLRGPAGLPRIGDRCELANEKQFKDTSARFEFRLASVHVYCFKTGVGMVALELQFESSDAAWIAAALYYLKKVSREKVRWQGADRPASLLELSRRAIQASQSQDECEFFYFANEREERANALIMLEVPHKDEGYGEELFLLRNCYHDNFSYKPNEKVDSAQTLVVSPTRVWGFTSEATVSLSCPDGSDGDFIKGKFWTNLNSQYLFMYVLLLHQKYALYHFLTSYKTSSADLAALEQYRSRLFEFQADYAFTRITEVPQYQSLYERLYQTFSIKDMFQDVREPLEELDNLRRQREDERERAQDQQINGAITMFTLLTVVSVLVDGLSFAQQYLGLWSVPCQVSKVCQMVLPLVLAAVYARILVKLRKGRKADRG